jgi:hypothetical protein
MLATSRCATGVAEEELEDALLLSCFQGCPGGTVPHWLEGAYAGIHPLLQVQVEREHPV